MNRFVRLLLTLLFRRGARRALMGRYRDPQQPELGRLVKQDIDEFLVGMQERADKLVPEYDFSRLRSRGNRLNATLGIYSRAAYQAMREKGYSHDYVTQLLGDAMWRVYALAVNLTLLPIRPFRRNPQARLNFVLRVFLFFPFNEDPAGYQRTYWKERDHYSTDWHRCVVYDYFREHATEEEIEFFRNTWCKYDFALPQLVHPDGYYERPHTLSSGDPVCDMRWYGRKPDQHPGKGGAGK
ncbi:MAG: L-2-amino-thiazoline-4-carboxylic acid hydrolase [Acidiferrobacterales bacterium]